MLIIRNAALAAAVVSLTACGGGGGGGSGSSFAVVPPTLQAPNSTKTYDVSTATARYNPTSGAIGTEVAVAQFGSTVTVTTDEAGRVSQFSIYIEDFADNVVFSETYTDIQGSGRISLNGLATGIQSVAEAGTGASGFLMEGGDLSYSTFGGWAYNAGLGDFRIGMLAGGNETPTAAVPTSGSATYTGATVGAGATGTNTFAFRGDAAITANFGANTVSTTFSNLVTQNISTGATGSLPTISGTGVIVSDAFGTFHETTLNSNGYTGLSEGVFYGPNAEETAGAWIADSATTSLIGSFGAKR